jgi:hypothetical protein
MIALPLMPSGSLDDLTPMEQSVIATEQLITALMTEATLKEISLSDAEREGYTLLSAATIHPAEA